MSNVLAKDRKETDMWYILEISKMCANAASMLEKRKKDRYYDAYAPQIVDVTIKMYIEAQLANAIMISNNNPVYDFCRRREHLQNVIGYLNVYQNLLRLYSSAAMENKSFSKDKAYKFLYRQGDMIDKIHSSVIKIIKKDIETYKKACKKLQESQYKIEMEFQRKWYLDQIKEQKNQAPICPIQFFD